VHDQLPPPLARAPEFYIRYAHPTSFSCHQLYIVIVAKPYAWLQEPCFCSVVIFVNIVRFPPIRNCQISSAIAETALYSRFSRGISKRERKKKRTLRSRGSGRQVLNLILPANQNNSPWQPKRSLPQPFATITSEIGCAYRM
jgi:hypothetical protein